MRTMRFALSLLAAAAGLFLIWGRALWPATTFGGMDFLNLLYPQALLVRGAFGAGEVPLWNWYAWGGSPLLAAMQSAPLYPPMWLTLLLPLPWGLQLNVFAHLVLAGWGAGMLARRQLGASHAASVYAAIAYAGSGFFLGHIEQVNSIAAMAWGSWILVGAFEVIRGTSGVWLLAGSVGLGLLAGHPQHVVLAVLFTEIAAVVWLASGGAPLRRAAGRIVWLQVAVLFAGLAAAAQLLPARELGDMSERVWPYTDPSEPALKWQYLVALVVPRFYNLRAGAAGQPLGFTELGMYAGVLTLPLFIVGLRPTWRDGAAGRALIVAWVFALLYALGDAGLVAPVARRVIGFLGHSRGAARSLNVATLLYAVIAARGLDALVSRAAARQRIIATAAVLLVTADLAITHYPELSSLLVRTGVLDTRPVFAGPKHAMSAERVYRFMARDSDYYLDHGESAVAQRMFRLQPNLNVLNVTATTDGYEEGLLPGRLYANFLRRHNRNIRGDTVDAPLLALLGVDTMVTEYPLRAPGSEWRLEREVGFGGVQYQMWRSGFRPSYFIDAGGEHLGVSLVPSRARLLFTSRDGLPTRPEETQFHVFQPPRHEWTSHPLERVTSAQFNAACDAAALRVIARSTNALTIASGSDAPRTIAYLQPWFPGWKVRAGEAVQRVRPGSAVFGLFYWPTGFDGAQPGKAVPPHAPAGGRLVYEPFSFRLGVFVSLASLACALLAGSIRILRVGRLRSLPR